MTLSPATVEKLVRTTLDFGRYFDWRDNALRETGCRDILPTKDDANAQVWSDLHELGRQPADLVLWLRAASARYANDPRARVFRDALSEALGRPHGVPVRALRGLDPNEFRLRPNALHPFPGLERARVPAQLGGRENDLRAALAVLGNGPLSALYAPSGYGKSSILHAGLIPAWASQGHAVAYLRRPHNPELVFAIADALVQGATRADAPDEAALEALLREVFELTDRPVIIVLDQFEEVFKATVDGAPDTAPRARIARLLAQTQAGGRALHAHWVLAYRQEFHGDVCAWLKNPHVALGTDSRATVPDGLTPEGEWYWPLPPLGHRDAESAIRAAIEGPLALPEGDGIRFGAGVVDKLAKAFAAARLGAHPKGLTQRALVPELQALLSLMLDRRRGGEPLELPHADVAESIRSAVLERLLTCVRDAFVHETDDARRRTLQTYALMALRRLTTPNGLAGPALKADALAQGFDRSVLDVLAGERFRLIVAQGTSNANPPYVLCHDAVAEVLTRLTDAELVEAPEMDTPLLRLDIRVTNRLAQWLESGRSDEGAVTLEDVTFADIERHSEALLWEADRRAWFDACVALRAARARARDAREVESARAKLERTRAPDAILQHVSVMLAHGSDRDALGAFLRSKACFDAVMGCPDDDVEAARAFVEDCLLPEAHDAGDFGRLVFGVELAAHPDTPGAIDGTAYRARRQRIRARLHERFGAPKLEVLVHDPGASAPAPEVTATRHVWCRVRGGQGAMGGEGFSEERPPHRVEVDDFELGRSPVTRAQYAAFDPQGLERAEAANDSVARFMASFPERDLLPVLMVDWFEAQAFAVWLDANGRLPTEREWEYAARGGSRQPSAPTEWWTGDDEAVLLAVAWTDETSNGNPRPMNRAVGRPEHPLALLEVAGGVQEWCLDAYVPYGEAPRAKQPPTLRADPQSLRVLRGGSFLFPALNSRLARRSRLSPGDRSADVGFRVARPPPEVGL
jgi:formylglycine-generating enzyme required for sulfatase activity